MPLGLGEDDATDAEITPNTQDDGEHQSSLSPNTQYFTEAVFDYGKTIVSKAYTVGTSQQTLYHPSKDNAKSVNDDDVLTFSIKPKEGVTFYPKTFTFYPPILYHRRQKGQQQDARTADCA